MDKYAMRIVDRIFSFFVISHTDLPLLAKHLTDTNQKTSVDYFYHIF